MGQAELLIQGDVLDLLAFSGAVHEASDGVLAEDGQVAAWVRLGQSLEGLSLLGGDRLALVALALPGQEEAEQRVAQGEELAHEAAFEGVDPLVFVGGLLDQGDHLARTAAAP